MTAQEAKAKIDSMISDGVLRRYGNTAERAQLDRLYGIAFAGTKPSNVNQMNTPKVWSSEGPVSNSDYLPSEIAAIVVESEPVIKQNEARRLLGEIHAAVGSKSHPYWNQSDPAHQAWTNGMLEIQRIADGGENS